MQNKPVTIILNEGPTLSASSYAVPTSAALEKINTDFEKLLARKLDQMLKDSLAYFENGNFNEFRESVRKIRAEKMEGKK